MFTCEEESVCAFAPTPKPLREQTGRFWIDRAHPQLRRLVGVLDSKLAEDRHSVCAALDVAGLRADAAFGDVAWVKGSGQFEAEWGGNISLGLLTVSTPPVNIRPHDF